MFCFANDHQHCLTKLRKAQWKKIVVAAESLASDVVEGKPVEIAGYGWQKCAMAEVVRRSGMSSDTESLAPCLDKLLPDTSDFFHPWGMVSNAAIAQFEGDVEDRIPGAVVFPLLAFADEARARARSAPHR